MKKIVLALLCIPLIMSLAACNSSPVNKTEKPSIVCTVFPVYDWIREILGDNAEKFELSMLGKAGMDLHSYQPTAQDIAMVSECDLFVCVGGTSDAWAEDIIKNNPDKGTKLIKLFDVLHDHIEVGTGEQHHDEHGEYDEHIWLSLNMAEKAVEALVKEIALLDNVSSEAYRKNAESYEIKLKELDSEYRAAVGESDDKTIIVADRFPFLYLVRDYDISYHAAFPGCSADADVSFETVVGLAEQADKLEKETLLVTENSGDMIAESVISGMKKAGVKIAVLNSCQAVTDIEEFDYLDIMRKNLISIKAALK